MLQRIGDVLPDALKSLHIRIPEDYSDRDIQVDGHLSMEAGFLYPVFISKDAYGVIKWRPGEDSTKHLIEPEEERLWAVLWMAHLAANKDRNAENTRFSVRLHSKAGRGHWPGIHYFGLSCTEVDDQPAVRIYRIFE